MQKPAGYVIERPLPDESGLRLQVCVLTYKRPELLRETVESLLGQKHGNAGLDQHHCLSFDHGSFALQILIIDNDPAMSGRSTFESLKASTGVPIEYLSEPARGIASARNRALDHSTEMDVVAFIDDDETADPEWLSHLVETMTKFNADVVTGPVLAHHQNSPEWVKRGNFFQPAKWKTGDTTNCAATNNVLIRGPVAKSFRFDPRFNPTGGEDTEYFMRVHGAGHKIVWSMEALVTETIPPERANLRWILSRARSEANRHTRSCLSFQPGGLTSAKRCAIACAGFFVGASMLPLIVFGRHYAVRGLRLIFRSFGTMSALTGWKDVYYGPSNA